MRRVKSEVQDSLSFLKKEIARVHDQPKPAADSDDAKPDDIEQIARERGLPPVIVARELAVKRNAEPELLEAYNNGQISLGRALFHAFDPPENQRLAAERARYLEGKANDEFDLAEQRKLLQTAFGMIDTVISRTGIRGGLGEPFHEIEQTIYYAFDSKRYIHSCTLAELPDWIETPQKDPDDWLWQANDIDGDSGEDDEWDD